VERAFHDIHLGRGPTGNTVSVAPALSRRVRGVVDSRFPLDAPFLSYELSVAFWCSVRILYVVDGDRCVENPSPRSHRLVLLLVFRLFVFGRLLLDDRLLSVRPILRRIGVEGSLVVFALLWQPPWLVAPFHVGAWGVRNVPSDVLSRDDSRKGTEVQMAGYIALCLSDHRFPKKPIFVYL